ncbi:MAG: calcium-binding protein [Selenomonadaceae bacterium]|nr:calcium-binding protein [Selenomonadaceae bacterium]
MKRLIFELQRFATKGTIYADELTNYSNNVNIDAGAGNDNVTNSGNNVNIYAGAGNDNISNSGFSVWIYGEYGNNNINNSGSSVWIYGGNGNEQITDSGYNNYLDGGGGHDLIFITNADSGMTVRGGAGYDSIYGNSSYGALYLYSVGDGSDVIYNINASDTISIGGATGSTTANGSDIIVTVNGSGAITLKGAVSKNPTVIDANGKIEGSPINFTNSADNATVNGTDYADTIRNDFADNVKIDGGGGTDFIRNAWGYNVTLNGGADDDFIYNSWGCYLIINGGTGADIITLDYGEGNTVTGGAGDDTIYLSSATTIGNVCQYAEGDGNDLVYNLSNNDTIQITSGSYSTSRSGDDFIISVGTGSMVLKNVYGTPTKIRIKNSSGNISVYNDWSIWSGSESFDNIDNYISNVTLLGNGDNDTVFNSGDNVLISGGEGDDSISNYYGENVTIDGGDGNDSIYNNLGYNVTIDSGAGDDSIYNKGDSVTIDGSTGNDSIYNEYGESVIIDGGAGADIVSLYSARSTGNDTLSGGTGDDTIYLNSTTTIGNVYQYEAGDGNDLIYNATRYDTISIGGGEYTTQTVDSDLILSVTGGGAMTLVGAASTSLKIVGNQPVDFSISGGVLSIGSTFDGDSVRASDYDVTTVDATSLSRGLKIYGSTNADCISGGSGNDTVYGSNGADTIFGNAGNDCLNGGNGNDILYGGEGADKLNGGNGNDTLYGGAGNDTLTGSNGADVFVYDSGNDLITDYRAGYDKIRLASGTISRSSISGTNVVFTIGSGTLTVRGARGRNITVIDASGRETTQKYSNAVYGSSAMLFSDDNFIGGGTSLDEITQKNYSVTNFSATSLENFAQTEYLSITSSNK